MESLVKSLVEKLNTYRDSYYNDSISLISDKEYDSMFDTLVRLEKETGLIMSNSPTQTVGYEVKSELKKVEHSHPMLSLDKTKSVNELKKFAGNQNCLLTLKMDGLTCLLTYDKGELIRAETRGNGTIGEDITHNARVFENIPLKINHPGYLEIEGEAIITYDDFEKINAEIKNPDEKYKNPRNLASGSVRQLDNSIAAKRHLKFVAWKVPTETDYMMDSLMYARDLGFCVVPCFSYCKDDEKDLENMIQALKNKAEFHGYPIDGLVMSYDDIQYGKSLGETGHHPRHSIAFKFKDEEVETIIKDIEWTMGKNTLTPTAVFEPVEIEGTVIERASLHNVSIMKSLELSKGDTITVYKANQIIPQVLDNVDRSLSDLFMVPNTCPVCGSDTKIVKDNDSEVLTCVNENCKGKLLRKLCVFAGKDAHDIKGLSEATLSLLMEREYVKKPVDLFYLKHMRAELSELPGMGAKSVDKLLSAIEECRHTTLTKFLIGLSIPLIGRSASKAIEQYLLKDFDYEGYSGNLYSYFMDSIEADIDWQNIEDFGPNMEFSMEQYCKKYMDEIDELSDEFIFDYKPEKTYMETSNKLEGKSICITGKLLAYKNRDLLVADIEKHGGKVVSNVTKKTDYLLTNDTTSGSSKNKKAAELNIPIITEAIFISMIGE